MTLGRKMLCWYVAVGSHRTRLIAQQRRIHLQSISNGWSQAVHTIKEENSTEFELIGSQEKLPGRPRLAKTVVKILYYRKNSFKKFFQFLVFKEYCENHGLIIIANLTKLHIIR
jgi:hypothetical protein